MYVHLPFSSKSNLDLNTVVKRAHILYIPMGSAYTAIPTFTAICTVHVHKLLDQNTSICLIALLITYTHTTNQPDTYTGLLLFNHSNMNLYSSMSHKRDNSHLRTHPLSPLVVLSSTAPPLNQPPHVQLANKLTVTPPPSSRSPRATLAACCSRATDLLVFARCGTHRRG